MLDRLARRVTRAGREIELQPREFRLLEVLMREAGRVVTRTMLLERVWDYHFDPQTNVIDVHVSRIRAAIEDDPKQPRRAFEATPYPQVFEDRHGFLPNLSILDLLFCTGPQAALLSAVRTATWLSSA